MYYSEKLPGAISLHNVKKIYGIDPVGNPADAAKIGIYPVTNMPSAAYSVDRYVKVGNTYKAFASRYTNAELLALSKIKAAAGNLTTIADIHIADWSASTTYAQDDIIEHEGNVYKALRASTNVEPGEFEPSSSTPDDLDWYRLY